MKCYLCDSSDELNYRNDVPQCRRCRGVVPLPPPPAAELQMVAGQGQILHRYPGAADFGQSFPIPESYYNDPYRQQWGLISSGVVVGLSAYTTNNTGG